MVTLQLETLYEDEVVLIQMDKATALLQLTFLRQPTTTQFRNGYQLAFDRAGVKGIRLWLTDAQHITAMLPENQSWLKQNMAALFSSSQLRKFAIVMAPECFVMTNPNQVYQKPVAEKETAPATNIKVHFTKDAALEWLFTE